MVRGSNSIKVQEWTERLTRFRKSLLSVARFCDAEGVSTASFYQWQRKLRKLAATNNAATNHQDFAGTKKRSGFQAVPVTASRPLAATPPALTVCLPGGIQVHVADNLPAIQTVMRELAGHQETRGHHEIRADQEIRNDDPRSGASAC